MKRALIACILLSFLLPRMAGAAEKTNVILITLDTVRADRMGFLGSRRGLTPNLDMVARDGVVFEQAYSQAPLTPVSHAAILTGTYPQFHQVHDFGNKLSAKLPYLPALLKSRGYTTGAFVSSIILDPKNGFAPGFERGFDVYDAGFHRQRKGENRFQSIQRRADDTLGHAMPWLESNAQRPFFMFLHLWDAHDPYTPPEPYKTRYAAAPYDGEIAYLDAALGKLFAMLRAKGLYENTLIAIMADHGEALGDHGEKTHGVFLYDATIHVPLLLKLPAAKFAGRRVKSRVSLVDVSPTILDLVVDAVPSVMQGQSLMGILFATAAQDRASFAETEYPKSAFGWSGLKALRSANFLYVKAPQQELYDLAADPAEKTNLAGSSKAAASRLSSQVEDFLKRTSSSATFASESAMDPKDVEKLTALGYVGASHSARQGGSTIDPKAHIQIANQLHDANLDIEDNRLEVALPLLQRVVASDPQIFTAQYYLGVAYAKQRKFAEAIPPLHKAIELQPDSTLAHYEMGLALFETGDWKTAAVHFEIVVNKNPKWVDARYSLASVYARIDRVADAAAHLVLVLEDEPNHFRANLLLGRILTLKGQADAALPYLEKAVKVQADSAEANAFLADAYEKLGRTADAAAARARAGALRRKLQ